jgi:hypothetical protein
LKFNFSALTKEVKKNNKSHMKSVVKSNEQKLAKLNVYQKAALEVAATSSK